MTNKTTLLLKLIIATMAMFIFYSCGKKTEVSKSAQPKVIDSLQGNWILHHYYLVKDLYWPGPASTIYKHVYPDESNKFKYLTVSKDSFFFTNPQKFTKRFPANISSLSFTGKLDVPVNLEQFQYSGYIEKDTLRISFNQQDDIYDGISLQKHISSIAYYKMVFYLK
jgi:hypothetical protein